LSTLFSREHASRISRMLVPITVEDGSSVVILCATASARSFSWARVHRRRIRLSQEPPIEGKRVGRACASSRLATWPSTSCKLFNHSVSSSVFEESALPSIGQENLVRATVGLSLGMVSKVWNPSALNLCQSLTKPPSPLTVRRTLSPRPW